MIHRFGLASAVSGANTFATDMTSTEFSTFNRASATVSAGCFQLVHNTTFQTHDPIYLDLDDSLHSLNFKIQIYYALSIAYVVNVSNFTPSTSLRA